MTEQERQRFEKEKENANRQFREMYRGRPLKENTEKLPPQTEKSDLPNRPEKPPVKPAAEKKQEPPRTHGGFDLLKMLNFSKIEMDNDRLLLLMLCLLLAEEQADEKLILALIYLML